MNTRPLLAAALVSLVITGCTSTTGGTASPANASSSAGSDSGRSAPKVPAALNTAPILADACAALSQASRVALGYAAGSPRTTEFGPSCTFLAGDDPLNQVDLTAVKANKNGLSDVYDTKANNEYFEPTKIANYPAVYAASLDARNKGKCAIFVAVTDELAVNIHAQYDHGTGAKNPCPVVAKVGEAMIQTLKG